MLGAHSQESLAVAAKVLQLLLDKLNAGIAIPPGAATEATLANILADLQLKADKTEEQPITAGSLPLPIGAATQTTLAAVLSAINLLGKLTDTQPVSLPTGSQTPTLQRVTNSGSVAAGATYVAFFNAGAANVTVAGATLKPNEGVPFYAVTGKTLGAIAYDGTGSDLMIAKVV